MVQIRVGKCRRRAVKCRVVTVIDNVDFFFVCLCQKERAMNMCTQEGLRKAYFLAYLLNLSSAAVNVVKSNTHADP